MEYTLPTTKEEMYATLQAIFRYYRSVDQAYQDVVLSDLELPRLNAPYLAEAELKVKAEKLVASSQNERLISRKEKIEEEIKELKIKLSENADALEKEKERLAGIYADKMQYLADKFLAGSYKNVDYAEDRAKAEKDYEDALADAESAAFEIKKKYIGEITLLENQLKNNSDYYAELFEKEKEEKFIQLQDEQEKLKREVFKYNNTLDEKEQRYANTKKQSEAALKLRHLSIRADSQTKEELIDCGYYACVLDVVSAYYDTMDANQALTDMKNEKNLILYLDDFYDNFLYMYYIRTVHIDIS